MNRKIRNDRMEMIKETSKKEQGKENRKEIKKARMQQRN